MRRKFLAFTVVLGALTLSACQEDSSLDEMIDETELNTTLDPNDGDSGDDDKPASGG